MFGSRDLQPRAGQAAAAAARAASGRVQGAPREAAPALLTLGRVDSQPLAPGPHRALNVAQVVLEVAHRHLELPAQSLELPGAAAQSADDPLPPKIRTRSPMRRIINRWTVPYVIDQGFFQGWASTYRAAKTCGI